MFADARFRSGVKTLNPTAADAYMNGVHDRPAPWDRYFRYAAADLAVFYLTRRLAALEIDRTAYQQLFGRDPVRAFAREFTALADEELVEVTGKAVRPTPRGMFYADAIASLFAWRRTQELRARITALDETDDPEFTNSNGRGHM